MKKKNPSLASNPITFSSKIQIEQFYVIESKNWRIINDVEAPKAKEQWRNYKKLRKRTMLFSLKFFDEKILNPF